MSADVHELYNLALEQHKQKNFQAALKILDEIHRLDPNHKKAYMLESLSSKALGNRFREAVALGILLTKLDFTSPDERGYAVRALERLGIFAMDVGLSRQGLTNIFFATKLLDKEPRRIFEGMLSSVILKANAVENFSAEEFQILHAEYKKYLADVVPYPKKFYAHEKIRVGFVSDSFRRGVVFSWSRALLTQLDKNFFATYFYSNNKGGDNITEQLRASADGWREVRDLTDEQLAALIREDEIDILFDLSGHTVDNRLRALAYHPASVQLSGIGFMGSTGLDCFEYFLSDVYCAGDENFFSEKVLKLPHSHICYEPLTKLAPADFPPCVKNNFVTFGSFNRYHKMSDSVLTAWKKILDAVPNSRLLLKHQNFIDKDRKDFVDARLKSFGFDLARVEMRGMSKTWLAEYADVDIALDTFPYTGGVTTCDALYMGVPVVSLYDERHGTRFGLSILNNVGFEELAVNSWDDYIARAVMLANDWELLTLLRKNLRTMVEKSPLMNSQLYLREIQAVFRKILDEQKNLWRNENGDGRSETLR